MHDLVIRNARICDGLGSPIRDGAVGVKDGRIAAVGPDVGPGGETVDAEGLTLAPGIIDLHTHFDAQITWDPTLSPSPSLGVTPVRPMAPVDRNSPLRPVRGCSSTSGCSVVVVTPSRLAPWA